MTTGVTHAYGARSITPRMAKLCHRDSGSVTRDLPAVHRNISSSLSGVTAALSTMACTTIFEPASVANAHERVMFMWFMSNFVFYLLARATSARLDTTYCSNVRTQQVVVELSEKSRETEGRVGQRQSSSSKGRQRNLTKCIKNNDEWARLGRNKDGNVEGLMKNTLHLKLRRARNTTTFSVCVCERERSVK
jgi:hypothetical protein